MQNKCLFSSKQGPVRFLAHKGRQGPQKGLLAALWEASMDLVIFGTCVKNNQIQKESKKKYAEGLIKGRCFFGQPRVWEVLK